MRENGRQGYTRNCVYLQGISPSLEEHVALLTFWLANLQTWAAGEGLPFDFSKSELQHFSRGKQEGGPSPHYSRLRGALLHLPSPPSPEKGAATRWLGIWFDQQLTFHPQCRVMAARAKQKAMGFLSLGNTAQG